VIQVVLSPHREVRECAQAHIMARSCGMARSKECTAFAGLTHPPRHPSHAPPSLTPHPNEPAHSSPRPPTAQVRGTGTENWLAGTYKMLPLRRPERVVAQGVAAVAVLGRGGEIVRGLVVNPRQGSTVGAVKGASEAHEWCQLEEHLHAHRTQSESRTSSHGAAGTSTAARRH